MIEEYRDSLTFHFPEVHADAVLEVAFYRTLRIPDDGTDYPLPPGLGRFPLRAVDHLGDGAPEEWKREGGVALPMYQSEAMWLSFDSPHDFPFAVKVATGNVNAITGDPLDGELRGDPQDYLVVPTQPWLDGYCVENGRVRQFIAMPLGAGYTAEEQITGEAVHGGLQLIVYPMKRELYQPVRRTRCNHLNDLMIPTFIRRVIDSDLGVCESMGLAPGGSMEQEIYDDPYAIDDWDKEHRSRRFVHIANSQVWRRITGELPPTVAPTADQYTRAGLPWFEWYADGATALEGSDVLRQLKSVNQLGLENGDAPLPENISVNPGPTVSLGPGVGTKLA